MVLFVIVKGGSGCHLNEFHPIVSSLSAVNISSNLFPSSVITHHSCLVLSVLYSREGIFKVWF
ncbi:hypothetical protein CDL12_00423 [Handroanthus impetiginosus]|uniref:Uncharacterized protein n=1 Tax=Handroanthus impetiginosus TaxID=429701 RepID=A0A2G9IAP5_9LAMI|nr:hypothetical protein CDL12_00423 [Handroanthus impetiginosus]